MKTQADDRSACVLKGLLRDHLRVDERVLATKVFPESEAAPPMTGLVG